MALSFLGLKSFPMYLALSSDIGTNKITGANVVGGTVLLTDTGAWKTILLDLSLADFQMPVSLAAGGTVTANQGTAGSSAWPVDTELPAASALDGTIGKGLSAPTVGAAILFSDGTNLKQVSATNPAPVAGATITKSVTFLRPHTTTPYSAADTLNVAVPITGGTQATPTVITAVAHGLADGDYVTIDSVVGDTNANGSNYAKVTGYTADTFALYSDKALTTPIVGNAGWSSGGTVARLFRLKNIFRVVGGSGYIMRVRIATNSATALLGDYFRIHFYKAPITVSIDNLAYALTYANFANRCGYINMPALSIEGSGGDMSYALAALGSVGNNSVPSNIGLYVENAESVPDTDLYFRIEELSTGTPANDQPMFVEVTVSQEK